MRTISIYIEKKSETHGNLYYVSMNKNREGALIRNSPISASAFDAKFRIYP